MSNPGPNIQSTQNIVPVSIALDGSGNPASGMQAAGKFLRRSCLVKVLSPILNPVNLPAGVNTPISWGSAVSSVGDPTGIWSAGDPTKLVVPSGYNRARVQFNFEIAPLAGVLGPDAFALTVCKRNGGIFDGYPWDTDILNSVATTRQSSISTPIAVTAGQYFTVGIQISSTATEKLYDDNFAHWFGIELWNE